MPAKQVHLHFSQGKSMAQDSGQSMYPSRHRIFTDGCIQFFRRVL